MDFRRTFSKFENFAYTNGNAFYYLGDKSAKPQYRKA